MDAHDSYINPDDDIVTPLRSALILMTDRYGKEIAEHCKALLRCDNALAEEFARRTLLEVFKRIGDPNSKDKPLRFILTGIASELCEAYSEEAEYGKWIADPVMAMLAMRDQNLIFLKEVKKLTFREIGISLGEKTNTIQKQYYAAIGRYQEAKEAVKNA